jgi:hypothetical protein
MIVAFFFLCSLHSNISYASFRKPQECRKLTEQEKYTKSDLIVVGTAESIKCECKNDLPCYADIKISKSEKGVTNSSLVTVENKVNLDFLVTNDYCLHKDTLKNRQQYFEKHIKQKEKLYLKIQTPILYTHIQEVKCTH